MLGILESAKRRGDTIEGLTVKGADLEDVFLKMTGREYRE